MPLIFHEERGWREWKGGKTQIISKQTRKPKYKALITAF